MNLVNLGAMAVEWHQADLLCREAKLNRKKVFAELACQCKDLTQSDTCLGEGLPFVEFCENCSRRQAAHNAYRASAITRGIKKRMLIRAIKKHLESGKAE